MGTNAYKSYGVAIRATVDLAPRPESISAARHFVAETLQVWGLDALTDVAELLASELVTNALIHAGSQVEVALTLAADEILLEVTDGSAIPVQVRRHDVRATTGRGMRLVAALSLSWGVSENAPGKCVWCVLPTDPDCLPEPTAQQFLNGVLNPDSNTT